MNRRNRTHGVSDRRALRHHALRLYVLRRHVLRRYVLRRYVLPRYVLKPGARVGRPKVEVSDRHALGER